MGAPDELDGWKQLMIPMSKVVIRPPDWIVPGALVPGMNLLFGPPKTMKSTLVLAIIASILEGKPLGNRERIGKRSGPVVYFPAEQTPGALRHIYETRVLKRPMRQAGKLSWDFCVPKDAWQWQIDQEHKEFSFLRLIKEWRPLVLILDPLVNFHSYDEADPQMIRPLVPLRHEMLKHGGALVIVHHARKGPAATGSQGRNGGSLNPWDNVRGTSALWGMADGGIAVTRISNAEGVNVSTEFKDHPGETWTWRVTP